MLQETIVNEEQKEMVSIVKNAAIRASEITQKVLRFNRTDESVIHSENMLDIIQDSIQLVMCGTQSRCYIFADDQLPAVLVDRLQIEQIINNLLINAVQAMEPLGGIIDIHLTTIFLQDQLNLSDGLYVVVQVSDQGKGIPKHIQERLFTDTVTTKDNGNGLGLMVSQIIIKQHRGHISFTSEDGKGTTLTILLPAASSEIK